MANENERMNKTGEEKLETYIAVGQRRGCRSQRLKDDVREKRKEEEEEEEQARGQRGR